MTVVCDKAMCDRRAGQLQDLAAERTRSLATALSSLAPFAGAVAGNAAGAMIADTKQVCAVFGVAPPAALDRVASQAGPAASAVLRVTSSALGELSSCLREPGQTSGFGHGGEEQGPAAQDSGTDAG